MRKAYMRLRTTLSLTHDKIGWVILDTWRVVVTSSAIAAVKTYSEQLASSWSVRVEIFTCRWFLACRSRMSTGKEDEAKNQLQHLGLSTGKVVVVVG